jgi:hypothetical protein
VNYAIAGQARTYLACPDGDVSNLDVGSAVNSILRGRTWVSMGLLTHLDLSVNRQSIEVRVLGPGWSSVDLVRVFLNGKEVKQFEISEAEGQQAGEKFSSMMSLADIRAEKGDFLCAVATGPGITDGWWMIQPPYQPDSPKFEPFVMGISPAVWVD